MKDIKSYSFAEIQQHLSDLHQPAFRYQQLVSWLYLQGAQSYNEMTNLPKQLRQDLAETMPLYPTQIRDKQVSLDGTRKYVLQFSDGTCVEMVGIPSFKTKPDGSPQHLTVCFSTQAGCAMECAFCATGKEGFSRNLSAGEMLEQILTVQRDFGTRVSHVVAMGQGEPFLNYAALQEALHFMNSKKGLEIGARHITISSCGIINGIQALAQEPEQFTLAISLHSAIQETRDTIMPRCSNQPLPQLHEALCDYIAVTNRRVTFEYLMIEGVNDTKESLTALQIFCSDLLCHVNLIPFNPVSHCSFKASPSHTIASWKQALSSAGIETTIRNSRGSDIDGACGQLKNKIRSEGF